jgi:YbbR domain-containing protein
VVAVAIWVGVNANTPQAAERQLGPVGVAWLLPDHSRLTVVTIRPTEVTIKIKGSGSAVDSNAAEALVNLQQVTRPGTYSEKVQVTVPTGTSLVSVTPATVEVTLEEEISRTFAVHVEASGSPMQGYGVLAMHLVQRDATVSGPSNQVDKVHAVVARVPVSGQSASFSTQVALAAVNAAGAPVKGVQVTPALRTVNVTLSPVKTLPVTVKYSGTPATGLTVTQIEVSPLHIQVYGTASALAGLTAVFTNPVNIAGANANVTTEASLNLPSGVTLAVPDTVAVTIDIGP